MKRLNCVKEDLELTVNDQVAVELSVVLVNSTLQVYIQYLTFVLGRVGGASAEVCYKISAIKYSCRNVLVLFFFLLHRCRILSTFEFP